MSLELQPQLNNVVKMKAPASYRNYKIAPISSSLTQIGFNQSQLTFELAANTVINWSKLLFSFKFSTSNCAKAVGSACYLPSSFFPWLNRIEIYTGGSSNFKLLDLNNSHIFSKCAAPLNTNYLDNPVSNGVVTPSNRSLIYDFSNVPSSIFSLMSYDPLINSYEETEASKEIAPTPTSITSYRNLISGFGYGIGSVDGQEIPEQYVNIRLGEAFPDTILGLDHYMLLNHAVFVRFTFNPINQIIGKLSSTTFAAQALTSDAVINVSNFVLNMYVEDSAMIQNLIQQQNNNGVEIVLPQVFNNIYNISGQGTKGALFKIQNMTGQTDARLYKLYSTLVGTGTGASNYILPTSNYVSKITPSTNSNGKYNYVSLYLNSKNLLNIDITARDHVNHIQNLYNRSSWTDDATIDDNGTIAHVFDCDSISDFTYKDNTLKGLNFEGSNDFTVNWQYTIVGSKNNRVECSGNYENHQFAVLLSKIYLKNGQISNVPF
jgi:hypothetical protein